MLVKVISCRCLKRKAQTIQARLVAKGFEVELTLVSSPRLVRVMVGKEVIWLGRLWNRSPSAEVLAEKVLAV